MSVRFALKEEAGSKGLRALLVVLVFTLALATRTYGLSSFPRFPEEFPWLGDHRGFPGLYRDEASYLDKALKLFKEPTTYQPWLHLLLIKLASFILDDSTALGSLAAIA